MPGKAGEDPNSWAHAPYIGDPNRAPASWPPAIWKMSHYLEKHFLIPSFPLSISVNLPLKWISFKKLFRVNWVFPNTQAGFLGLFFWKAHFFGLNLSTNFQGSLAKAVNLFTCSQVKVGHESVWSVDYRNMVGASCSQEKLDNHSKNPEKYWVGTWPECSWPVVKPTHTSSSLPVQLNC